MMAALASVFMLLSYFPYLTYAVPAIAGLFIMVTVIEINRKWAFAAYISSAVLVFLLAETESKLMYVCFFGYYPILKAIIEGIHKTWLEWLLKLIAFNAAVLAVYFCFTGVLGVSAEDFGILGKYGIPILLLIGNAVFAVYDNAVSRMAASYIALLQPKLKKFLR